MGSYFSISISAVENSYSIENNTSNVTVSLWCNGNNGWADDNPSYWLKVNGNEVVSGTKNFSYSSFTVCSWTDNVPHNADGTGSITYQGYYQGTDKPNGDTTAVYTLNLTTIPRASEILNGTTQRAIDGTISFSVDKKNENFVDKLTIYPTSNTSLATVVSPYTTGSTFTIGTATFNSIKALAPTTSYTSMVVQVETFTSSGAVVGTASSQFRGSFSVTAPTISPTWSASTVDSGVEFPIITGHDRVKISLGRVATADLGTTISAYEFTIGTTTFTTTGYSVVFESVEDNDVSVKIKDRRGLSTTVSTNNLFNIIEYFKPTINASIQRSPSLIDTGAVLTFNGQYTWKNQDQDWDYPLEADYKINNGNWTTISSFEAQAGDFLGSQTFPSGTFDAGQEYSIYLRIYDPYADEYSEKRLVLSKASIAFDIDLTNQRVAVGQPIPVSTTLSIDSFSTLESGSAIIDKNLKVGNALTVRNSIYCTNLETNDFVGAQGLIENNFYVEGDIYEGSKKLENKYALFPTQYVSDLTWTDWANTQTLTWTVHGSGFVYLTASTRASSNNDTGTAYVEILLNGNIVAVDLNRLSSAATLRLSASASAMMIVSDGNTITVNLSNSKGGTAEGYRRAMAFGCTLT